MKERFKLPVAVHLILIQQDKILLLRRYNTGYEDGNYSVIAGHIDGNEDIKNAMIREAKEEAGICIDRNNLDIVLVMHRLSNDERIDYFLLCRKWTGLPTIMEPDKCDQLLWMPINHLPDNMIDYIYRAITMFNRGIHFDSMGFE